jgi:hypothetical protein
MLAQEPRIGFRTGKTRAVDPRLLTCADAYSLTAVSVANGIMITTRIIMSMQERKN